MQVKDVNFAQQQIIVCDGKGRESRVTMLPVNIAEELKMHLQSVKLLHQQDFQKGYNSVFYHLHLKKSILKPNTSGFGNLFSFWKYFTRIRAVEKFAVITSIKVGYKKL